MNSAAVAASQSTGERWDPELPGSAQVAEEIVRVMMQFLRERLGRGPEGYRTYVVDDLIVIRLLKVLTPLEHEQARVAGGWRSIKDTRNRLIQDLRPSLEGLMQKSTGAGVISIHADLSTKTGEHMIILVLDRKVREPPGRSNGIA
jgi:uncharacterized protein YbcI